MPLETKIQHSRRNREVVKVIVSGSAGRIAVRGETIPVHLGLVDLRRGVGDFTGRINRAEGGKLPPGAQKKVNEAVHKALARARDEVFGGKETSRRNPGARWRKTRGGYTLNLGRAGKYTLSSGPQGWSAFYHRPGEIHPAVLAEDVTLEAAKVYAERDARTRSLAPNPGAKKCTKRDAMDAVRAHQGASFSLRRFAERVGASGDLSGDAVDTARYATGMSYADICADPVAAVRVAKEVWREQDAFEESGWGEYETEAEGYENPRGAKKKQSKGKKGAKKKAKKKATRRKKVSKKAAKKRRSNLNRIVRL